MLFSKNTLKGIIIPSQKQVDPAEGEHETVDVQDGQKGHEDHEKQVPEAEPHDEHGGVHGDRAAQKGREQQFSVPLDRPVRLISFLLRFEEAERIKIDGENIYAEANI